jgi:hypothetical protein
MNCSVINSGRHVFSGGCGLDLSRVGYGPVAAFCGRGNKSYDSVRYREFSDQNDC